MGGLLKNEFIKLYYKRKFFYLGMVIVAITIGINYTYYQNTKNNSEEKSSDNVLCVQKLEAEVKEYKEQVNYLSNSKDYESISKLHNEIRRNEYLITNKLALLKYNHNNGFSSLVNIINELSIFYLILVAIVSSDSMSSEYSPPVIKTLLTKPIKRTSIILSKYFASLISLCAFVYLIQVVSMIVMVILLGGGDYKYPYIINTSYRYMNLGTDINNVLAPVPNSGYIISLWKFIILVFIYQFVLIAAITAFFQFISTICRNSALSISVSITLIFGAKVVSPIIGGIKAFSLIHLANPIKVFLPSADIPKTILFQDTEPLYVNLNFTVLVLLISILVGLFLTHLVFAKQEIKS